MTTAIATPPKAETTNYARIVAARIAQEITAINQLVGRRTPDGSLGRSESGAVQALRPVSPAESARANALSKLASWVEGLPITDARIYALARREAYVHGDVSAYTPNDAEKDVLVRFGTGGQSPQPSDFEEILNKLAVEAQRETLAHADAQIADLTAQLSDSPDETAERLRADVKRQEKVNKTLAGRMDQLHRIAYQAAEQERLKAQAVGIDSEAARLQAERDRIGKEIDKASRKLAAELKGPDAR